MAEALRVPKRECPGATEGAMATFHKAMPQFPLKDMIRVGLEKES